MQGEGERERTDVIDVDRALEVVEAIMGEGQRTADRKAGVVDEDVHGPVFDRDLLGESPDVVYIA